MDKKIYDVIIIGSGPAGLTAGIYASRYALSHLVIGQQRGGTVIWAHRVDNYPGFFDLSGVNLAEKFIEHVKKLGGEIVDKEAVEITREDNIFKVSTSDKTSYWAKTLILAMGTKRRELKVPGEKIFIGRGVSYCATCDAAFYKGKTVAMVGGANAACSGASHLAKFAKKVYLLYRRKTLRAEPAWIRELTENNNAEILYETNVLEIKGKKSVEKIILDKPYKGEKKLLVEGVFIEIGGIPASKLAQDLGVKTDPEGYVETDKEMVTNIPGVFCAGDMNAFWKDFQQVITATAMGAIAGHSVYEYLKREKTK